MGALFPITAASSLKGFPPARPITWSGLNLKNFKPTEAKPLHSGQEVAVHVEGDERVDVSLHLTKIGPYNQFQACSGRGVSVPMRQ